MKAKEALVYQLAFLKFLNSHIQEQFMIAGIVHENHRRKDSLRIFVTICNQNTWFEQNYFSDYPCAI